MVASLQVGEVIMVVVVVAAQPIRMKMHYRPDWMHYGEDDAYLTDISVFCITTTVYLDFQGGNCSCFLGSDFPGYTRAIIELVHVFLLDYF
jgi:hypothetical protein